MLKKIGFKQSAHEAVIYRRGSGRNVLLVGVYVNDLIITDANGKKVDAFKALMKNTFDMSDLGLLSFYLGSKCVKMQAGSPSAKPTTPSASSSLVA
jgi:hypothetical protein